MTLLDPSNMVALPPRSPVLRNVSMWAEEAIFGHRLHARQTPWLLFLEFLNVANAFREQGALFEPTEPAQPRGYGLRYRMGLRNLMFNNEDLLRVLSQGYDNAAAWQTWITHMDERAVGVTESFSYLEPRFRHFRTFAEFVTLVRQTALESDTNRRWSSRFIFPFGPEALYSDAIVKETGPTRDFTNFGRTGEMLYLMLSRSGRQEALRHHFTRLLDPEQPKNRLVARLCAPSDHQVGQNQEGYTFLPYRQHPAFERLADDWLSILSLRLPEQDAYAHLVPLAALHVVMYQLETAATMVGRVGMPALVCEMIAPRREFIRQRAIASYQDNDALTHRALEAHIDRFLSGPRWQDEVALADLSDNERLHRGKILLGEQFHYNAEQARAPTSDALLENFREEVLLKHDSNCGQVHAAYSRYAGLVSRRGTNRYRYAPTDMLLKTLVLANVPVRLEYGKFLMKLYERYGFVFGPVEAERALPMSSFDLSTFERNRERLEARLTSMGLLNRLSDGCAFVENPFAGVTRPH